MMTNNGLLVVLSGPSGSGKDTVLADYLKNNPQVKKSISMTTRAIRDGETDGIDYIFVDNKQFDLYISDGMMLEYVKYSSSSYGTPKGPVDNWLNDGKTVILKIEVEGASNIRKLYPDAVLVFIVPPSLEVLENRLRRRGSEDEDGLKKRLEIARNELNKIPEYDYIIVNDELEKCVEDFSSIINAELCKVSRNKKFISEVTQNV